MRIAISNQSISKLPPSSAFHRRRQTRSGKISFSAIEVNAGCGPPAARARSRPASPCRPAQRSWRTPTQDLALAQGLACSDVALGLGDPKPRSVDAGKTFVGAAPGVGKTYAMLKDARPS